MEGEFKGPREHEKKIIFGLTKEKCNPLVKTPNTMSGEDLALLITYLTASLL